MTLDKIRTKWENKGRKDGSNGKDIDRKVPAEFMAYYLNGHIQASKK